MDLTQLIWMGFRQDLPAQELPTEKTLKWKAQDQIVPLNQVQEGIMSLTEMYFAHPHNHRLKSPSRALIKSSQISSRFKSFRRWL